MILIDQARPLTLTKRQFFAAIGKPRVCQRALYWSRRGMRYVEIVVEGGRGKNLLIDTASAEQFYQDWKAGIRVPPLLPNETGKHHEDAQ